MDGSESAEAALEYAIDNDPDADIVVLHVIDITAVTTATGPAVVLDDKVAEAAEQHAKNVFDRAHELAAAAGHEGSLETVMDEGKPAAAIVSRGGDVDTIVMGSQGRDGAARLLLGSVAETVVRRASVPVTVVR